MKVDLLEQKYAESLGVKLRPFQKSAIKELLNNVEYIKSKPLLVRLPTGYGKTLIGESLLAYEAVKDNWSFARGLTYVLPTRAITHDVAIRLSEHLHKFRIKSVKEFHGESDATNFYADVSVATFDTFLYAFARRTHDYHLERPAGVIATSYVVFDEAHMVQDEYIYSHSVMGKLITLLHEAGVPTVIMTATIPKCIENVIFKRVGEPLCIPDDTNNFKENVSSYRGSVEAVTFKEDANLFDYLKSQEFYEELRRRRRILIVANTVERAVKAFEIIKEEAQNNLKIILLHSHLRLQDRRDREELARKLLQPKVNCDKCGKKTSLPAFIEGYEIFCDECKSPSASELSGVIVVATQVVEAGLDVSCELLVTEGAPADALVQRAGRCARKIGERGGTCVILKPINERPYPSILIEETLKLLREMKDDERVSALTMLSSSYQFVNGSYRGFEPEEFPNALKELRISMETTLRYLENIYPFIVDQEAIRRIRARPNTPVFIFAPMSDEKVEAILMVREGEGQKSHYKLKEKCEATINELIERAIKLPDHEAFFINEKTVRDRIFTLESIYLIKDGKLHDAILFPGAKRGEYFITSLFYTRPSLLDAISEKKARYYKLEVMEYDKKGKKMTVEEGTYVLNPHFYHKEYGFVW
ncbi:MAG: CRISPR-associated helicase Cas3' [Thermofilaceae archaeon]|nr:CRISPR-associated helicase Cas3' [Thermofilaceae archaeon]